MKKDIKNIFIIIIVSIFIMIPLIISPYIIKDDTMFHLGNIKSSLEMMKEPFAISDISINIAGKLGYATRMFYPIMPHTTAIYICKIFNISVISGVKLTYLLITFLSGITMYMLSNKLTKNKNVALLSAIIYILFPYRLANIYIRDALAESFAFIFYPLILYGLEHLFENPRKFITYFVIGYVGGMLSHLTMMVYFTFLLIPFFLINIKKIFNKKTISSLLIAAAFILLITSPMICNMFQNKLFGTYRVFIPGVMAQGIWHSGLYYHYFNYLQILNRISFTNLDYMRFYPEIIALILFIQSYKEYKDDIKKGEYKYIFIFLLISLLLSSILFPWDILPGAIRIIQFPWRCMCFVAVGFSLLSPLIVKKSQKNIYIIISMMLLFSLIFNLKDQKHDILDINNIDYNAAMGWQKEYLPQNAYDNLENIIDRDTIVVDNGTAEIIQEEFPNLTFIINKNATVELPRIYYFGYELYNQNDKLVEIKESSNGLIESNLTAGTYKLKYEGTFASKLCKKISIVTIIIFVLLLLINFVEKLVIKKFKW